MVSAIGSSPNASTASAGASAASFQAQLDRYQKQLSDCVNCSSAKTPEGQAAIRDLSAKIAEVKGRIEAVAAAKQNAPANTHANRNASASGTQGNTVVSAASSSGAATATVGSILSVFA